MKIIRHTQPATVTWSTFLPKRQISGVVAVGGGWEFANQYLHMQYLLEKICFVELVDNHVRMGKGEERRKEEEGKEGEKEKLSIDLHTSHWPAMFSHV